MADTGDPLLNLLGYRDALSNGTAAPRRPNLNFVGTAVTDNPTLNATDVNLSGLVVGSSVLAATADLVTGTLNRYDGSAVATYSLPSTPTSGDIVAVAETTGGTATVTFDGNGNNLADPTNATPGTPGATMTISQARASMFWKFDGTTWLLQSSPVTPVGGGGAGTLAATLALGNTTGGTDLEISSGDKIVSPAGSRITLNTGGQAVDTAIVAFEVGSAPLATIGVHTQPTNGNEIGFYVNADAGEFSIGMLDKVGDPGSEFNFIGQSTNTGAAAGLTFWGGDGVSAGGSFKFRPGSGTAAGGFFIFQMKSGATQGGAGAAANELWKTSSHATLPDNVVLIGV